MSPSFMLSIPTNQLELRDEIEQQLATFANINETPRRFDVNEIKMIVEIIAGASTILVNGTAIITFLLLLKDRYKQQGKASGIRIAVPGQKDVPLDGVDEAILKRMMGLDK